MKILVIGDPHFKITNVHDTTLMSTNIINIAKEKQPDLIVVFNVKTILIR